MFVFQISASRSKSHPIDIWSLVDISEREDEEEEEEEVSECIAHC